MNMQNIDSGLLESLQEKTLKSIYKISWARSGLQDITDSVVAVLESKYKTTPLYNDDGEFVKFIRIK